MICGSCNLLMIKWIRIVCGVVAAIGGVVFLASWHLDCRIMLQLPPSDFLLPYMSALMVFLSGVALLSYSTRYGPYVSKCLGLIIVSYALIRLFEISVANPFVSTSLIMKRLWCIPEGSPLMRVMGASAFSLVGFSLVIGGFGSRRGVYHYLVIVPAFFVIVLALLGPVSYLLPFRKSVGWAQEVPINFYISILLIFIGIGLIAERFYENCKKIRGSRLLPILVGVGFVLITIIIVLGLRAEEEQLVWVDILFFGGFVIAFGLAFLVRLWQMAEKTEELRRKMETAKAEFISAINHEMRGPLATINGSLELLYAQKDLSEKEKDLVDLAHRNSSRLMHIANDFLDLERMELGKLSLAVDVVDLKAVLKESVESVKISLDKLQISVKEDYGTSPIAVLGDYERLVQVVTNILSNAIKYSPERGTIYISLADKGDTVCVSIRDQGKGIPKEFQTHIFERFFTDASRPQNGTGLGLVICKGIIEQLGGEIGFSSEENVGTTFYFTLKKSS